MGFWAWLSGMWNNLVKAFKEFIAIALPIAKQIIIGALKDIALEVIEELSDMNLSNEAKRKEAFVRIKDYAIKEGIEAKDSVINLVIEMAVQAIKTERGE